MRTGRLPGQASDSAADWLTDLLVRYRWLYVVPALLPVSTLFNLFWGLRNSYNRRLPGAPERRALTNAAVHGLEALRLAPSGTTAVSALLNHVADDLVEAGVKGIFTPLFFFHARRPHSS